MISLENTQNQFHVLSEKARKMPLPEQDMLKLVHITKHWNQKRAARYLTEL